LKNALTEFERLKLILKAISGLDVRYLFSYPTKKIDYYLENICDEFGISLIIGSSETVAIESALGYAAYSNNIPIVIIDCNFIPPNFNSYLTYAASSKLAVVFVFVEPLPSLVLKELDSIDLVPERINSAPIETRKPTPGPRILVLDKPFSPNLESNQKQTQIFDKLSEVDFSPKINQQPTHAIFTLVDSYLEELLKVLPNSIILPDAGTAHKAVSSRFQNYFNLTLNSENNYWMGVSLRAVRGVSLAQPEQIPIVVIGDGSMLLQGTELAWLVKTNTSCIVLLLINGQLGNRKLEKQVGGASKLPFVDWEKFLQSLGLRCIPVQSSLDSNLIINLVESVKSERRPLVIPLDITLDTDYLYSL
jgi:thiamine pyrophosphate-dependent acetolactate synthase large subunit-like protein